MPPEALHDFLAGLTAGKSQPLPAGEAWAPMIERITTPGAIQEIAEETWDYFLDVLPPHWMARGAFTFAEGAEPWRLFWRRNGRFFCRQLTWDETRCFIRFLRGGHA